MLKKSINSRIMTILITIMMSILTFVIPVFAYSEHNFNGGYKVISNNGASAYIEVQNPYVTTYSSSSAWVMTCDGNQSFAQVGWVKRSNWTGPKNFYEYEYEPSGAFFVKEIGDATAGSYHYRVSKVGDTMYFYINGATQGTVPISTIPFTRSVVEYLGETQDTDDQSPGSVTNPLTFSSAQYKNTSDSWVSAGVENAGTSYGYGTIDTMRNNVDSGDTTWEIWDSRY